MNGAFPAGIEELSPQVKVGPCAECGMETGDGYYLVCDATAWESEIDSMGWVVHEGRLLCFDCLPAAASTEGQG